MRKLHVGFYIVLTMLLSFSLLHCSSTSNSGASGDGGSCPSGGGDASGKSATLAVSVSDTAFSPSMLTADNLSTVTLTLTNTGTRPHGFAVQCFPPSSVVQPIGPGASATITFVVPNPEGTYNFSSNASGDTMTGQFVDN
jgi:hypothetical protein